MGVATFAQLCTCADVCLARDGVRCRYTMDQIYTSVGDILLALNPFKPVPLYSSTIQRAFQVDSPATSTPHVYGIALTAYKNLLYVPLFHHATLFACGAMSALYDCHARRMSRLSRLSRMSRMSRMSRLSRVS
jgi:hypothetical protein